MTTRRSFDTASGSGIQSVAALTTYIKGLFDSDPRLTDVWVQGEASNCRRAASGHWYWTLKDEEAGLKCVMWRYVAAKQTCLPEEGAALVAHGSVSVYPVAGQYQLYVDHLEPMGVGDLYRQYEALKAKLEAEGLFDPERKRPLPGYPSRIGVVTSADAAALRDVCEVMRRRWPSASVMVAPTMVQGEGAPRQIVAALDAIGRADVEVVILCRGGGSIEDLWAFNDEGVARAVAACPVPVICGVGHETDFTIADFVSDVRAPTPSAAAELAVPDGRELAQNIDRLRDRLALRVGRLLHDAAQNIARLEQRLSLMSPQRVLAERRSTVNERLDRLYRSIVAQIRLQSSSVRGAERRLEALSPLATLTRGYAHVSRRRDGLTVRSVDAISAGEGLDIRVVDGSFGAVAEGQQALIPESEQEGK